MQSEHFFILVRDNINNSGNRIRRSWKINFLISGLVKRLLDRKSDTARSWYKWTFLDVVPVLSKKQKPSWQSVCGWGNYQQEMFKKGAVGRIHIQMAATEIIVKLSPNLRRLDKGVKQALLNKDTKVKVNCSWIN